MRNRVLLLTALVGAGLVLATSAQAQTTVRVSVASDGTQGNFFSATSAISADGRFVAFQSWSNNLVIPDDNDFVQDIFVHDRDSGTTERVSVASDGTQANNLSESSAISADGRFVAFYSAGTNLVPDDTNGKSDIFVHDRDSGTTELISVASDGTQGNSFSLDPAISADGRFVAFRSDATNLVAGDTNSRVDVFVHDRVTGVTERVSVASNGNEGNGMTVHLINSPAISADGRIVAFWSDDNDLVPGDTNGLEDIFVHDRDSGTTERVSVASDGTQGNSWSKFSAISADGRFVAFQSEATNLVPGDTNGRRDIFVHDRDNGTNELASVASDGTQGNFNSFDPAISADGRVVAFRSYADNLVPDDTSSRADIFVHDRDSGITERVSVASDGTEANDRNSAPAISADGRFVAFTSWARNLVPDTNDYADIFLRDRGTSPQLSLVGACPGSVSLSLTAATPDGLVAFGWGTTEGSVALPRGPCAGTETGLADPSPLGALTANQAGAILLDGAVGAGVCGLLLQAIDVATCQPSNVASVP